MSKITVKDKTVKEIRVFLDHDDEMAYACRWAIFTIEPDELALSIQSDNGNMSYRWQNIGDNTPAGFYKFLSKIDKSYFLRKLSEETVFDFDATVKLLLYYVEDETRPGYADFIRSMEPCGNEYDFANQLMAHELSHSDDLECIKKGFPAGHKAVAEIFEKYVQSELKALAVK